MGVQHGGLEYKTALHCPKCLELKDITLTWDLIGISFVVVCEDCGQEIEVRPALVFDVKEYPYE